MSRKSKLVGLVAALIGIFILGASAAANDILTVADPDAMSHERGADPGLGLPQLLPGSREVYAPHERGQKVARRDGRAVAQLGTLPDDLRALRVWMLDQPKTAGPDTVAFTVLSSLEYTVGNHRVFVTTTRPSAAATQQKLNLGNEPVGLANGTTGYATTGIPGAATNQIVFAQDGLIITIAGDLPLSALKGLANRVVVGQ